MVWMRGIDILSWCEDQEVVLWHCIYYLQYLQKRHIDVSLQREGRGRGAGGPPPIPPPPVPPMGMGGMNKEENVRLVIALSVVYAYSFSSIFSFCNMQFSVQWYIFKYNIISVLCCVTPNFEFEIIAKV